jgi:hypothetical protein
MIDVGEIEYRWAADGSKRDERGRRAIAASDALAAGRDLRSRCNEFGPRCNHHGPVDAGQLQSMVSANGDDCDPGGG